MSPPKNWGDLVKFVGGMLAGITGLATAFFNFKAVIDKGVSAERTGTILLVGGIVVFWVSLLYVYIYFLGGSRVLAFFTSTRFTKWARRLVVALLIIVPVLAITTLPIYGLYKSQQGSNYLLQGILAHKDKKFTDAIANFSEAIKLNPEDPYPYHNRGQVYIDQNELDKAMEDENKCVALSPPAKLLPLCLINRGYIYKKKGDTTHALEEYRKALEVRPDLASAYNNIGRIYLEMKKYEEAVPYFEKAILVDKNFAYAYSNRGQAFLEQGDHERALQDINRAIGLDRMNALAFATRGKIYLIKDDKSNAIANFQRAFDLSSDQTLINEMKEKLVQLGVNF